MWTLIVCEGGSVYEDSLYSGARRFSGSSSRAALWDCVALSGIPLHGRTVGPVPCWSAVRVQRLSGFQLSGLLQGQLCPRQPSGELSSSASHSNPQPRL
ncbi:hypothetical protein JZ751_023674 [Albula glossodonta]|uniref:Uncharacterized protein n=1 Tax=Albula glossodonta TaxID=121402 RepID=A0A8T2NPJ8_9TELE|nr:hypothetical protein JZ751_023674 [Albula glossodonta]